MVFNSLMSSRTLLIWIEWNISTTLHVKYLTLCNLVCLSWTKLCSVWGIRDKEISYVTSCEPYFSKGGFGIEGTETKSLLYPKDDSTRAFSQHEHQVRQFENPSIVQDLLYPTASMKDDSDVIKKSRGFERPTRIKEMMYPNIKEKGTKGLR